VDTAELLRTYGKFAGSEQENSMNFSMFKQTTVDLSGLERENDSLKRHISALEESLRRSDDTLSDLRTRLNVSEQERREAQRLLTHQPEITEKAPSTNKWLIGIGITVILVLAGLGFYMIKTNAI
jgi:septal ring factor EnvC (AmiA/AmiB activator)